MNPFKTILRGGVALALGLGPALATAQDGKAPNGPPAPGPPPTQNKVDAGRKVVEPPRDASEPLPPVPATATDPAPPGTRAVRVDVPGAGAPANAAGRRGAAPDDTIPGLGKAAPRGMADVEGVVVRILKPGTSLGGERVRFVVNTTRDWPEFLDQGSADLIPASELKPASSGRTPAVPRTRVRGTTDDVNTGPGTNVTPRPKNPDADTGPGAPATPPPVRPVPVPVPGPGLRSIPVDEPRAAGNARPQDAADVTRRAVVNGPQRTEAVAPARGGAATPSSIPPKEMEFVLTRDSKVYTFARDPKGNTLYDPANPNAPVQTGADAVRARRVTQAVQPTNFTNLRDGMFVAVRYRTTRGVNEVVGISLIVKATDRARPLPAVVGVPGGANAAGGPADAVNRIAPGGVVPGELPGEGPARKAVVPRRPIDPVPTPGPR